jgi:glycerophosphoryl diester phosphodiesterase
MAEMVLLNPWMIRQAHREDREVYIWFGIIENPTIMRVTLAFGVDGLMVDNTVVLAEILER